MSVSTRPAVLAALLLCGSLHAQVVPSTPTRFATRSVGDTSSGGGSASVGLAPNTTRPAPSVREISYIALSDSRQWTSSDGRTLVGKLIAFEQLETTRPAGAATASTAAPALPSRPTLLRQNNARLLVNQKPVEVPLSRLAQADQDFIRQLDAAIAKKAAAAKAP